MFGIDAHGSPSVMFSCGLASVSFTHFIQDYFWTDTIIPVYVNHIDQSWTSIATITEQNTTKPGVY